MAETAVRTTSARPIPEGFHTITPTLTLNDAAGAIEFYKKAFGAKENNRAIAPDGKKIWHADLTIGDSHLMLSDEFPEMAGGPSPKTIGAATGSLWLYVEDADAVFHRAVAAGAETVMEPSDQFWGDRWAQVKDPFGYLWSLATHVEDVSEEEMCRRAQAFGEQNS